MTTTSINTRNKYSTGINVFVLPDSRRRELLEALHGINEVILRERLPMIVASNFHVGIGSPVVINYNQYTDRALGQVLRTVADAAPLMKLTHDLSDKHEIRWYQVADVVAPKGAADEVEISSDCAAIARLGILVAKPGKRDALLSVLKSYGEALRGADARGFLGLATHRGDKPEQVACYERWQSLDAYKAAAAGAAIAALDAQVRDLTDECERHLYQVVEVARFDLGQISAAASARAAE